MVAAGLTPFSHVDCEPGRRFEYEIVSYVRSAVSGRVPTIMKVMMLMMMVVMVVMVVLPRPGMLMHMLGIVLVLGIVLAQQVLAVVVAVWRAHHGMDVVA